MRILDPKWTDAQRECIRLRGETILVSAAAGSGKTAVLTERILDRVLDEEQPLDLSKVLVVTFTRAAAAELRSRIRGALASALAETPGNRRLQTQLMTVGSAKICTIDSFCLDLIRAHFAELGLSAGVSVSDDAEAKLTAKNVMNELIDDCYSGLFDTPYLNPAAFGELSDHLVSARAADSLAETLLSVRETVNGYEEGIQWLIHCAEDCEAIAERGFLSGESAPEASLRAMLVQWTEEDGETYRQALELIENDEVYDKNYGDTFRYAYAWISSFSAAVKSGEDYRGLRERMLSYSAPALRSGIRGEKKTAEITRCKAQNDAFTERRRDIRERFFVHTPEDVSSLIGAQAKLIRILYEFLSEYERRLWAEKTRRKTLDFGDLGRLALRLLLDGETGDPSPLAVQESQKFEEIYIDEYQDVSPVQDRIFSALSRGDNRFMVGDAKQSIYAFRGASPELFLGYRQDFANDPSHGHTVFLQDNFRCDGQVIAFSNLIFSVLFGIGGGLPYEAEDALVCSKKAEGTETQKKVSVALLKTGKEENEDTQSGEAENIRQENAETTDTEEGADGIYTEEDYIADRIAYLLKSGTKRNGERLRPRDIAILLRSAKSASAPIAKALERRGIPSFNNVARAFFENAEVLLMYSLLTVIDNPQKDVFLAGALKSPLYRVTLDELVYLRQKHRDGSLYDALCAFTEETGFSKGKFFLERLSHYRKLAKGMPVDRFLWMLYEDTGILSLVYEKEAAEGFGEEKDPQQMRANLMMFYEYARQFEAGAFQGLYQFVLFIGDVIEEKAKLPPVQLAGEDADAVHIMTVHQSKGLEFPVCFVPGLGRKFNEADRRAAVMLDRETGIATYIRDETGLARIDHPLRSCIRMNIGERQTEEEMRILYVALTRAREQLYLSAAVKEPEERIAAAEENPPTRGSLRRMSTAIDWILTALACRPEEDCAEIIFPTAENMRVSAQAEDAAAVYSEQEIGDTSEDGRRRSGISYAAAKKLIGERFSFVYPWEEETQLPAKTAVSALLHDEKEEKEADLGAEEHSDIREPDEENVTDAGENARLQFAVPRFLSAELPHATAAQRGTATHLFMQFCDYAALSPDIQAIKREISRLTEKGFLLPETAENIDCQALCRFAESSLFRRLCGARELRRELRFNLHFPLPGTENGENAEKTTVLVQGIIDCIFTDADGRVVLLDYKTDHISKALCPTPEDAERLLKERHAKQLSYYRYAAEQLLCRPLDEVRIYSFALGYDFPV